MLGKLLSKILPRASTHDGASIGRRLRMWLPFDSGPKREHITLPMLRARSRDACRNNPIARAAVERMVTDVIGAGISPKPVIESEALRMRLIDQWEAWSAECDVDGQTDFYGLQTLAMRAMLESGECFAVLDTGSAAGIPLRIRLLESDHLPFKNEKLKNGNIIVDGIEFDAKGRRVAYWLHPRHPGDPVASSTADSMNEPRRVTADRVIHLFEATRPGQIRGVPWLASVLVRLKTLDEFNDAQLERQKLANLFVGFIRRPPPEPGAQTIGPDGQPLSDDEEQPPLVFEPGMLQELGPGEDVTFSEPPGTSTGYLDFTRAQLRDVASALGIPYAILTGDFDNVNDRVVRVAINEYKRRAIALIRNVLVPKFCTPIRNAWCDAAVLAGALPSNKPVKATRWTPHGWAYLHPVQDVQADVLAINNKLKSRSEALLERGYDAELIDREIASDMAREQRLGLSGNRADRREPANSAA